MKTGCLIFSMLLWISPVVITGELDTLTWNHNLELQWSDFKARPKPGNEVVAVTASGLSFSYTTAISEGNIVDVRFNISALFYPEQSWYLPGHVSDIVLDHERLHFDITELYARKFRKRLMQAAFTRNIDDEIASIYQSISDELNAYQLEYDRETNHSRNVEKQREWRRRVLLELSALSYYSEN